MTTPRSTHADSTNIPDAPVLHAVFDECQKMMLLLDEAKRVVFSSWEGFVDGKEKGLINRTFFELISEKDKEMVAFQLNKTDAGEAVKLKSTLIYAGECMPIEISFSKKQFRDEVLNAVMLSPIKAKNDIVSPGRLRLMAAVVSNLSDAVIILELNKFDTQESKIVYVNQAFPALTGYGLEELLNKAPSFLTASIRGSEDLQQLRKSMAHGLAFEQIIQTKKKTGSLYWVNASFSPIQNENELLTNWIIVLKDVSNQVELEKVYQKASSLAGMGSWAYTRETGHLYWSSITREIYEVEADFEPNLTNTLPFFKNGQVNKGLIDRIINEIRSGRAFDLEAQIVTAKRNKRWIRITGEPELHEGQCIRVSGSFHDIDKRKNAEILAQRAIVEKAEIFESITDGFFAVDKNWKITYWNSRAAQEVGRDRDSLLHHNLWDVFSEGVGSDSYQKYHEAIRLKKPVQFETLSSVTGQWYDVSAYPSKNGLSVYFRNISDRKAEQALLIDTEKRYSDLFHLSPLPKWVFEVETLCFLDVNKAALAKYGYTFNEFMAMSILDIRPEEEIDRVVQTLQMPNADQVADRGIFEHRKKNGERIRVNIQSTAFNYKGRAAKLIIAIDMTEQERYINAIEDQNDRLREVAWIQSHVFRAPLTKIMGLLEVAKISDQDEDRRLILDYIQDAAVELDKAINKITNRTKTFKPN